MERRLSAETRPASPTARPATTLEDLTDILKREGIVIRDKVDVVLAKSLPERKRKVEALSRIVGSAPDGAPVNVILIDTLHWNPVATTRSSHHTLIAWWPEDAQARIPLRELGGFPLSAAQAAFLLPHIHNVTTWRQGDIRRPTGFADLMIVQHYDGTSWRMRIWYDLPHLVMHWDDGEHIHALGAMLSLLSRFAPPEISLDFDVLYSIVPREYTDRLISEYEEFKELFGATKTGKAAR